MDKMFMVEEDIFSWAKKKYADEEDVYDVIRCVNGAYISLFSEDAEYIEITLDGKVIIVRFVKPALFQTKEVLGDFSNDKETFETEFDAWFQKWKLDL